eukprot:2591581-Amphidinium_carterae.3
MLGRYVFFEGCLGSWLQCAMLTFLWKRFRFFSSASVSMYCSEVSTPVVFVVALIAALSAPEAGLCGWGSKAVPKAVGRALHSSTLMSCMNMSMVSVFYSCFHHVYAACTKSRNRQSSVKWGRSIGLVQQNGLNMQADVFSSGESLLFADHVISELNMLNRMLGRQWAGLFSQACPQGPRVFQHYSERDVLHQDVCVCRSSCRKMKLEARSG